MKAQKYDLVKRYFNAGLWDLGRVENAVWMGWITERQFEEITAHPFDAEEKP